MRPTHFSGSFPLFRLFGIQVCLHWSWFVVVALLVQIRVNHTEGLSVIEAFLQFITLFGIVLMHEFGHALACRSVGGEAHTIVLWPLGGVAFVKPPPRPGPVLWSIAAGPLVNVFLVPVTLCISIWFDGSWDPLDSTWAMLFWMNLGLLIFNMLPIYPLDGGQILQALLWFVVGRATSLRISAWIGLIAAGGIAVMALSLQQVWLFIMTLFIGWQAWKGLRVARFLALQEKVGQGYWPSPY